MRKWLALASLLLLAACIDVDDMGGIWAKGTLDPALEGTWMLIDDHTQGKQVDSWQVSRQGDVYLIQKIGEKDEPSLARTIAVNGHSYLLLKSHQNNEGALLRYAMEKGKVLQYDLKSPDEVKQWMQNQPDQPQIEWSQTGLFGNSMKIKTLDESTLKFIDNLPQWKVVGYYKKQ